MSALLSSPYIDNIAKITGDIFAYKLISRFGTDEL